MNRLPCAALALSTALLVPAIAYAQHAPPAAHSHSAPSHAAPSSHAASHPPVNPPVVVTAPAGARESAARDATSETRFASRAKLAMFSSGPVKGFLGPAIANPNHWNEWQWNEWEPWSAQPFYYGGSFWGPWMTGTIASSLQYGAIADVTNNATYPSYEVATSSPGATLLADYGLEQSSCGAPNLVVIWGPNDSVACALPNARVRAGNYEVDPATLTLRAVVKP